MSSWRVRKRYGFGAGSILLNAEPYFGASMVRGPRVSGNREAIRDFMISAMPMVTLPALVFLAVVGTMSFDRPDRSALEVTVIPRAPEAPPELSPIPELEPPPAPPVAVREPEPKPAPEPAPEPKKIAPVPAPVQQIAKAPAPPPPPTPPVQRVKPAPKPRPMPAMAAFDAKPLALPERQNRQLRDRPQLDVERRSIAVAPAAPTPALEPVPAERPTRFASVRPPAKAAGRRVSNASFATIAAPPPEASVPETRSRRTPERVTGRPNPAAARVALAPASPSNLPTPAETTSPVRTSRAGTHALRNERRAAPALLAPALSKPSRLSPVPAAAARAPGREGMNVPTVRVDRSTDPSLAGVALASLAACLSDREEEALKRRLVAAVTTQRECVSAAGTYRFVETKNLNAFLMMIQRAPHRPEADRCAEMTHALECVGNAAR